MHSLEPNKNKACFSSKPTMAEIHLSPSGRLSLKSKDRELNVESTPLVIAFQNNWRVGEFLRFGRHFLT